MDSAKERALKYLDPKNCPPDGFTLEGAFLAGCDFKQSEIDELKSAIKNITAELSPEINILKELTEFCFVDTIKVTTNARILVEKWEKLIEHRKISDPL